MAQKYNIIDGPGKWDLSVALFERCEPKKIYFTVRDVREFVGSDLRGKECPTLAIVAFLLGVKVPPQEMEKGPIETIFSSDSEVYEISGALIAGDGLVPFKGTYDIRRRGGVMTF